MLDSDGQDPSSEYSANMQLGLKPLENKLPDKQTNKQTNRVRGFGRALRMCAERKPIATRTDKIPA